MTMAVPFMATGWLATILLTFPKSDSKIIVNSQKFKQEFFTK